jgi:tetratricopeptide (TPR) repeat protein
MRRSDAWRRAATLTVLLWGSLAGGRGLAQIPAQPPARLIDVVEVEDHGTQVDITVNFNCSMRYLTHLPATHGNRLTIELQPLPDCRLEPLSRILGEIPPLSGARRVVSSVHLDSEAPGRVSLTLELAADEQFVLGQGIDLTGLRIRLLRPQRARARMVVGGPTDEVSYFAVNLDSELAPFAAAAMQSARSALRVPVFVSETVVEGRKWYRLRAGPFATRRDAERVLEQAVASYPRAWLAIADDAQTAGSVALTTGPALPPVQRMGTDPPLDRATQKRLLSQADAALRARDYATAIRLLTELQRQPEFRGRAQAQELLGMARERAGQLAQAQAEYEEYLRRYPNGEAAARVALRLRILRAATLPGGGGGAALHAPRAWEVSGGVAQMFRYDSTRTGSTPQPGATAGTAAAVPDQTENEDALYTDVDLLARHHGDTSDLITRLSAGYIHDFGSSAFSNGALGNSARVSLASVEWVDRAHGIAAEVGRQVRNDDGILGTFDGIFASYHWRPAWAIDVAAGYPVELTTSSPQTRDRFESLALDLTPPGVHWDGSLFATVQTLDGVRDRRAVGLQGRYLASRASLVALADYDTSFHSLNAAMLLGTLQLPARWSVSFDAERRNSPVLTTQNALIGQPAISLLQLQQIFTLAQIYQLARDRTPATEAFDLTVTRPLGERFELAATVAADRTAATVASGGVEALPATGLELSYQAQLYGSSLWSAGDFNVLTLTYSNTEIGRIESVGVCTRLRLFGPWRIGPGLSLDHSRIVGDGSTATTIDPSILIDYQRGLGLVELQLGGEIGRQSTSLISQRTQRYFASLAYRIGLPP